MSSQPVDLEKKIQRRNVEQGLKRNFDSVEDSILMAVQFGVMKREEYR
jgi:hypothetical protein